MRALVLKQKGEYPIYTNFDLPKTYRGKSEINLNYSALNHRDLWIIKGMYAGLKYPIILGSDGMGLYKQRRVLLNPGQYWGNDENVQSKNFKILGLPDHGTFAEKVYVDEQYIYDVPSHLSDEEAAALPLAGLTAYRALLTKAKAKGNQKILVAGIGGGVALFVLLFAKALGMEIYVSSSQESKIKKAVSLGAKAGVNYRKDDWDKTLAAMSGGVDIIIDSAGGKDFNKYLKVLNPAGKIVVYGGTGGAITNISPQILFWKQISILGTTMGSDKDFQNMLKFVASHKITPVIDSIYELKDFDKAIKKMESGMQFGKLVLKNA